MSRFFIQLSYKGTNFHGWQTQPNAVTVQETVENALKTLLQEDISITGCGRTDTGVHARYYIAHFDTMKATEFTNQFLYRLNKFLPKSIAIQRITKTHSDANARFDATSRTYKYYITMQKNPFLESEAYFCPYPLDIELMNKASEKLLHYTDFTSFSKLHTDTKTNNCNVTFAQWHSTKNLLIFTITSNRFLRDMVRAIVGTLLQVGKGKCNIEDFETIILQKDRGEASSSAQAQGLFLEEVIYPYKF